MRTIITLVICFCLFSVQAADKVSIASEPSWLFPVKPNLAKKPDSKEISNGYYLELIDRQTELSTQTGYTHLIRHIINETGVQNASEVSVTFAPEYQQVVFHKLAVIRNGVVVSNISLSQIRIVQEETDASDFQYNGLKRAFVILNDIRKEDRLDIAYSVIGTNPVFKNKFSTDIYFSRGVEVTNFYETIIASKGKKLKFKYFNNAPAPDILAKGNETYYHWKNPPLIDVETSYDAPSWFTKDPYVTVTEYDNWKEVISWGLDLFRNYSFPVGAPLKNKITAWQKEAAGDRSVFTVLATRFVQDQVRYLGLEIGSYTHQPHDPNKVFEQRYGDCKDKALLLAIILRQQGIPAFVALANTAVGEKLTEQDASPGQFNHAIVAIQQEKGYRFIDATMSFQRGKEQDIYIPAYGYGLVLNPAANGLEPIKPGMAQTTILEKLYVKSKNEGNAHLLVESDFEGGAANNNRSTISGYSIRELENDYRKFYARYYDSIQMEDEVRILDDSLNNKIHVTESYTIPELWHTDEKGKDYINVYAHFLFGRLPDPANAKGGPLAISFPQNLHYTLELHLPETWSFPFDDYHISNECYQFDYTITRKDSIIILDYKFVTFRDNIPVESMSRYQADYKLISNVLQYSLSKLNALSNSDSTVNNGSVSLVSTGTALFVLAFMVVVFLKLNKRTAYTPYVAGTGQKLGGWTIVLGITMVLGLLVQVFAFFQNNIFSYAIWERLGELGGSSLQRLLLIEESIVLIVLCSLIALLYWYIRRRDIFPGMFISYIVLAISAQILLMFFYSVIPYPASFGDLNADGITRVVRLVVYGLIWSSYVMRSERVKTTFIEPYQKTDQAVIETLETDPPEGDDTISVNRDVESI